MNILGRWEGNIETYGRQKEDTAATAARSLVHGRRHFHAVSFTGLMGEKIASLEEYWGDDGLCPDGGGWAGEKLAG